MVNSKYRLFDTFNLLFELETRPELVKNIRLTYQKFIYNFRSWLTSNVVNELLRNRRNKLLFQKEYLSKQFLIWLIFLMAWCRHIGVYYNEWTKRTKFLLAVIYRSPRRHSSSSKTLTKIGKTEINLYDHFRTSWIL